MMILKLTKKEFLCVGAAKIGIYPMNKGGCIRYPSSVSLVIDCDKDVPIYRENKPQEQLDFEEDYISAKKFLR